MTEKGSHQLTDLPTWLSAPNIKKLFDCLDEAGITSRFVGGCVRDHLLKRPVNDFDIAVDAVPEKVMEALDTASIKSIPTGLSHGTVTAVIDHQPFELTTLRKDVETDGRHAVVEFTDDWLEDAARRDFTMNALYLARDGQLFDYFDGLQDAQSGHVRFVGDPELRMEEDGLRLLRYFRFSAHFSKVGFDEATLNACRKFSPKLGGLAAERIWQEWAKTLTTEKLADTLHAMNLVGVFEYLYRKINLTVTSEAINRLDKLDTNQCKDPIVSLSALHWDNSLDEVRKIGQSLRLSNKDASFLYTLFMPDQALNDLNSAEFYSSYYKLGAKAVASICWIELANGTGGNWQGTLEFTAAMGDPVFPLQGRDLLHKGVEAGPQIGNYLAKVKDVWMETGFKLDQAGCLAALDKLMEES